MLSEAQHHFVASRRVAHLATVDRHGAPYVVAVCFALDGASLYIAIDRKPKGDPRRLKRLRNIAENPAACVTVDRWDEDWRRLAWVMLRGRAEIIETGAEHARAQALVRARYAQLAAMDLAELPVIALRIAQAASWGDLSPDDAGRSHG